MRTNKLTTQCLHVLITTHSNKNETPKVMSYVHLISSQCQFPPLPTDPKFLSNTGFLRSVSFKKRVIDQGSFSIHSVFQNSQDVLNFLKGNNYIGSGCKQFQNDQTVQSEYEQTKTTRSLHVLITTHSNKYETPKVMLYVHLIFSQCQFPPLPTDPSFL